MRNWSGIVLVILTVGVAAALGFLYSTGSADLPGHDRQPIRFDHELHAGQLQINCLFCHRHATASTAATIPSVQLCVSCHDSLATRTPEMDKLARYWSEGKPIPWIRLQRLPDFVYFTHEMHLKTGLQCVDCHGRVETMRDTPRAATYEMGWCLTCHTQQGASVDCWTCHK